MNYLSQIDIAPEGGFSGIGEGTLQNFEGSGISAFSKFISSTIGLMTIIAIIWFIFTFFTGAISLISAGGDKASLEAGRKKIINGIIGLVVTIAAIFIIRLVGFLLGFDDILNIESLFENLTQ